MLADHLWVLLPDVFMVILSEVTVDIVKHAFITKFNDITADVRATDLCLIFKDNPSQEHKYMSSVPF